MKITSTMVEKHWQTFSGLSAGERDKIIHQALFSGSSSDLPRFSGHTKLKATMDNLVATLKDLGCSDIIIKKLPRSERAIVSIDGNDLSAMPEHKAIAFIAYMVAIEKGQ